MNSPTWTAGKLGTGLQFGVVGGQQVQVPDQTALRLGTTLTLSFWMKLDSVPSAATRLVGKGASDTAQNYGVWTAAGDQHLFFKFHKGTTLQSVSTTTTFSTGTWYHVAVTLGSGQVQFYVNGAAQSAVAATGTPVTSTDPLTFGYAGYNGTFGGSLDEVSLFNTVLTSSQVSELYATYGMGLVCRYNVGTDLIGQERYSAATSLWAASYYGYDGLGSVRVLYDSIGTTTDTYTYDAFGTLNSSTGSTTNYYRFAGEQWDEDLKLYYNRARYLNPDTGKFASRDSWDAPPLMPGLSHKYIYASSDPVNRIDPSGHMDGTALGLGAVGGGYSTLAGFELSAIGGAKAFAITRIIAATAAIAVVVTSDRTTNRFDNVMRLQLQEGTHLHYWSRSITAPSSIGVTRQQVQIELGGMFAAMQLQDALRDDWDTFSFGKWEKGLWNAIIRMSLWVGSHGPVSGYYTAHQEYLDPTDETLPRIDLEYVYGINLRK